MLQCALRPQKTPGPENPCKPAGGCNISISIFFTLSIMLSDMLSIPIFGNILILSALFIKNISSCIFHFATEYTAGINIYTLQKYSKASCYSIIFRVLAKPQKQGNLPLRY
jgi:hypothetical protein